MEQDGAYGTAKAKKMVENTLIAPKRTLGIILYTLEEFDRNDLLIVGRQVLDRLVLDTTTHLEGKTVSELRRFLANCAKRLLKNDPERLEMMETILDEYLRKQLRGTAKRDRSHEHID